MCCIYSSLNGEPSSPLWGGEQADRAELQDTIPAPNSPRGGHNQELALHRDGAEARPTRSAPATAISWGYHHPREEKQSPHLECSVCSASSPIPGCLWVAELPQQGQDSKEIWQGGVPSFDTPSCTAAQGRVTGAPFGESPERWLFTVGFVVFVFFLK